MNDQVHRGAYHARFPLGHYVREQSNPVASYLPCNQSCGQVSVASGASFEYHLVVVVNLGPGYVFPASHESNVELVLIVGAFQQPV